MQNKFKIHKRKKNVINTGGGGGKRISNKQHIKRWEEEERGIGCLLY